MDVDIFKDILVPVIGGLGIFLLGLDFMDTGIQSLSVNKMRQWLAKMAGTPAKGVAAGTIITGIIQSSTAMTVMTVGLAHTGEHAVEMSDATLGRGLRHHLQELGAEGTTGLLAQPASLRSAGDQRRLVPQRAPGQRASCRRGVGGHRLRLARQVDVPVPRP